VFEYIVIFAFLGSMILGMALTMLNLIGASLYDLKEAKKRLGLKKTRKKRYQPLISVIIPAHDEALVIERCLTSISKNAYKKYEVIVVNDASKDDTKQIVETFIKKHPKLKIRLLSKRKNVGRGGAINAGFKAHGKGELIMALDADCVLDKQALKNAVQHFEADPGISALAANIRVMEHPSILGILQEFEYLTAFRSKKFNVVSDSEYIVGGAGAVYRRDVFKQLKGFDESMWTEDIALSLSIAQLGNKAFRLYYASDVEIYTEPVPTYLGLFRQRYRWKLGSLQALFAHRDLFFKRGKDHSKALGWFRLPLVIWGEIMLLLEPILVTYFLYLALNFRNPTLYGIVWLVMSLILAFTVWADERLPLRKKLRLTFFVPIMYPLFYIMSFIQIAAMFKSVFNRKKITGQVPIRGSWVPPKRIAADVAKS
jgi:poly-beta-1,6-N-acetyl-D-glucosamine synthase